MVGWGEVWFRGTLGKVIKGKEIARWGWRRGLGGVRSSSRGEGGLVTTGSERERKKELRGKW